MKMNFRKNATAVAKSMDMQDAQASWKSANYRQKITLLVMFVFAAMRSNAQDAAEEINELWEEQINPILNAVLGIAVGIAAVWCGILFFQGKKEALKTLGYIIAGAVVIKVLATLVKSIIGTD